MNRVLKPGVNNQQGIPRTCGDEPDGAMKIRMHDSYSPHVRG